jgi:hypothetical protein
MRCFNSDICVEHCSTARRSFRICSVFVSVRARFLFGMSGVPNSVLAQIPSQDVTLSTRLLGIESGVDARDSAPHSPSLVLDLRIGMWLRVSVKGAFNQVAPIRCR